MLTGLATGLWLAGSACVQATELPQKPLTYADASSRLDTVSDAIKAADAFRDSRADTAASLDSLNLPTVSLAVQAFRYQKTLDSASLPALNDVTANGKPIPPPIQDFFGSLPDVKFSYTQDVLRPVVSALWPVYTGGKITSAQEGARAMQRQAEALAEHAHDAERVKLATLYFGQALAEQMQTVRCQVRDGMEQHLKNAQAMERQGMATRAQRMQVEVARDASLRGCQAAARTFESARIALSNLLRTEQTLTLASPLFLITTPLDTKQAYVERADNRNAQVRSLDAASDAAAQVERAARSQWKPTVVLLGEYNLKRSDQLVIDPDWIVGIGVRYELLSNVDRQRSISAARRAREAAQDATHEARTQVRTAVATAYEMLMGAREQYELLQSSEALARENVRIQALAFREGQGTATEMIDAENLLAAALVERAAAAYNFDVTLAQLLDATGQMDQYPALMRGADKVLAETSP
ncbi:MULTISPECIES: TolC family protein [Dyella]|nr:MULTISPECIES: TolC family protein [Dyella]